MDYRLWSIPVPATAFSVCVFPAQYHPNTPDWDSSNTHEYRHNVLLRLVTAHNRAIKSVPRKNEYVWVIAINLPNPALVESDIAGEPNAVNVAGQSRVATDALANPY